MWVKRVAVDAYTPLVCKHYLPMRHPVSQISILETQIQISETPKMTLEMKFQVGKFHKKDYLAKNGEIPPKYFNNNRPRPI